MVILEVARVSWNTRLKLSIDVEKRKPVLELDVLTSMVRGVTQVPETNGVVVGGTVVVIRRSTIHDSVLSELLIRGVVSLSPEQVKVEIPKLK
jgi:hypothetical protein